MKKISISLLALLAFIMTACTEDYSVPNNLTVNNPESAMAESDVTVTPAGATSITIADFINEDGTDKQQLSIGNIQVAQGKLPANSYIQSKVYLSLSPDFENAEKVYEVKNATLTSDGALSISPSVLSHLYSDSITRKPDVVTIYLATKVLVVTNNTSVATVGDNAGKYFPLNAISFTPDAVKLEDAYYYIGAVTTNNTYQFANASGGSFYDDPEISVIVPALGEGWHWFRIAGASSFNADGSINWDLENANNTSICPVNQNDEGIEGKCINGTQSWHLIESEVYASYRITINLLEMTYSIKGIKAIPEYYPVGTLTGWNANTKTAAMFPTSGNTVTMTTYFTGAWDMRMWPAENFGNWDKGKAIGISENGGNAASGSLCWNTENDGNLASPEAGYYTLDCDYKNMTYQWTKHSDQAPATYEKIGLVGANDDWGNDIFLTQVTNTSGNDHPTHLWYALDVKIDYCSWGVQFRANAAWDKQWGKGDQGFPFGESNTTSNIEGVEPGTYNIYFNDITGHYYFVAQE